MKVDKEERRRQTPEEEIWSKGYEKQEVRPGKEWRVSR